MISKFRPAALAAAVALAACDGGGGGGGAGGAGGGGDAGVPTTGLTITSEAARACELRFVADPGAEVAVRFGPDVKGSWRRREDRVAITLVSGADAPFAPGAFAVGGVADLKPELVRCYDADGRALEGADVVSR